MKALGMPLWSTEPGSAAGGGIMATATGEGRNVSDVFLEVKIDEEQASEEL